LPPGDVEIYTHPAVAGGFERAAAGDRYAEELEALLTARTEIGSHDRLANSLDR
jgi:hypothetical protein